MKKGIGGHQRAHRGHSDDWLTPPELVRALGPFDLDPCASVSQPWETAHMMWDATDDGIRGDWWGLVWLNPPYGPQTWKWVNKLADHGSGVALVFARTETEGFFEAVWGRAWALYFLRGRLHFHHPKTGRRAAFNSGAPSVLVAYGEEGCRRIQALPDRGFPGRYVPLTQSLTAD